MDGDSPRAKEFAPRRFLFESLLIVTTVALGFAVTEWRQHVVDQRLAAQVLQGVRVEVERNVAQLDMQIARHQQIVKALSVADVSHADQSAWDVLVATMIKLHGGLDTPPLHQAAWDLAVSSGSLKLLDYEAAAALSEIYTAQTTIYTPAVHLVAAAIYVPAAFQTGSRREILQMARALVSELEGNERYLRDLDAKNLPRLAPTAR